jgi:hypothetical protein
MMKYLIFFILLGISSSIFSAETPIVEGQEVKVNGKKVIYTYKQFEKFDFDDLTIEGEAGTPNDLSISPIHEKSYSNRLPYRKSFTVEIKKGIERVR